MEQLGQADMDHAQRQVRKKISFQRKTRKILSLKLCDGVREVILAIS